MKTAVERRNEIVEIVNREGKARVEDLASIFNVSNVTIRSDLTFLESNGYIVRSHGAAIPNTGLIAELSVQEKRRHNASLKSLLGQAASRLIKNGDTVILDSGTTTLEIARGLKTIENVVVMTNGLDVAMELSSKSGVEVLTTGGVLRKNAMSFSGSQAEQGLRNHRFDKVFLGVDGFDIRSGITTYNESEASLNRLMCEISETIIAVVDSSKFGKRSCHMIRDFGSIHTLVTDSGIPEDYVEKLRLMGVEVIIVEREN
ncbi:DeoR/GlpR transcriptional regulator [Vibrio alfacsensis]|jgi:DeoR family transcriptional regulator of aga operon|uniref:DeoR/GlpR transcriptional regulator n=1 Tax=Vibrio alfacsensis TaxID=1074311 RepID=A0ABN5PI17_9VIBR|nr:transcriptional repressor AgaR [Vibrio alfacsensis]AXY02488.1 DeoR/GlpR transcriptional regulator [Vibrio alfacsensis]BBM67514.1 DeoR family transcriptional regulator [Vibrio alfacsensis]